MAKPLQQIPFFGKVVQSYRERLTPRGRYLFWTMFALALLGLDIRRTQVFILFAVAAAMFLVAAIFVLFRPPRVTIECRLPARATALEPLSIPLRVASDKDLAGRDIHLSFPRPHRWGDSIRFRPKEMFLAPAPGRPADARVEFTALRRGRYILRGPAARFTDPLRLTGTRAAALPDQVLLVYPRFYTLEEFIVPAGRRYQPGGIPLSSSTGDAIEFVGTREYREGDPLRNIHWRSWARRGRPVVKEYQEEYFCRIALILDTFLPKHRGAMRQTKPGAASHERAFEAAVSVAASVADFFGRSEYIVDILAAGPDLYEVSAGRSLAYLENILDVLACLEPCYEPPFQAIGPPLFEKLAQITTVVAVLQDWDEHRERFLRRIHSLGTSVRALIVHEGLTTAPWQNAAELGQISAMTPDDVERLVATGPRPVGQARGLSLRDSELR